MLVCVYVKCINTKIICRQVKTLKNLLKCEIFAVTKYNYFLEMI